MTLAAAPPTFHRPQWKETLFPVAVGEDAAMVVEEDDHALLRGRVYPLLVPLLDGGRTLPELIEAVAGRVSPPELIYALHLLRQRGYLIEADPGPPESNAFWHALDVRAQTAQEKLRAAAVALTVLGDDGAAPLWQALAEAGVRVTDGDTDAAGDALNVVVADDYLLAELAHVNRRMLAAARPWLLVKPRGKHLWIGPLFLPGRTGCWRCLAQRLEANRQLEAFLQRRLADTRPLPLSVARFPSLTRMVGELVATETVKFLATGRSRGLEGCVVSLDTHALETTRHALVRRPQCPDCGDPHLLRKPRTLALESRKKTFTADGGHRAARPEETLERLRRHVSPITGVVSSIVRFEKQAENGLTFSYSAGHNFALVQDNLYFLFMNLRNRSGGKGTSDVQARVSAMCEAIERYSGVWRGEEHAVRASYDALDPEATFHPNEIMGFSEAQFRHREAWNDAHASRFHKVPERFDPRREIDWTPVWSLTEQRFKNVPSAYCYFGHPDFNESLFCTSDANGNASGNTLEEAVLQGFMELVERDAVALWWYNRVRRPRVDLASFGEPYVAALAAHYRRLGREFWMLDVTTDLGIPAFAAVSRRVDRPVEDVVIGFGAHFDPRIAMLRALTEINQFLPCVTETDAEGDTVYWFHDPEAIDWWKTATIAGEPYLVPDDAVPARKAEDFPRLDVDDLAADVATCVEIARRHGLETLVLDQTQPDVGLSVVKVIVPGLRHFWKRFGPGRLYDVPVRLGWLERPRAEEELNPIGIFF